MYKKTMLLGVCAVLVGMLALSGCSAQATPESPTLDANAIYTQAAATVSAGLALTEAAKPSATVTPIPPATQTPTMINQTATATQAQPGSQDTPTATGTQASALTPQPSLTPVAAGPTASTSGDKAEWISNSPADKAKIKKGDFFDLTFTVKNTGTTTWTGDYLIRFFVGEAMGVRPVVNFPITPVKPGETVTLPLGLLQAPQTAGNYMIWFKLTNPEGKNFYDLSLELEITN